MTRLIGLLGKARAGKDTLAGFLVADHGYTRFAFADVLKDAALALDPIVGMDWENPTRLTTVVRTLGWEKAKERDEVRRTLQYLGVAMRDHVARDIWLSATMRQAKPYLDEGKPVVITDVRFPNEVEAIRAAGGKLVRVVRPDLVSTDPHVSETLLDTVQADATVMNSSLGGLSVWAASIADYVEALA